MTCNILERLNDEGSLVLHHDYLSRSPRDWSRYNNDGVMTDTAWAGRGVRFGESTSSIVVPDSPELQLTEGTLVVFGKFKAPVGTDRLISKRDASGTNYDFQINAAQLRVYDGTAFRLVSANVDGSTYLAANIENGTAGEGFKDGISVGAFDSNFVLSVDNADLLIGNWYGTANNLESVLYSATIINRQLTATEHSQLYGLLSNTTWPTKTYSILKNFDPNELVDGNMEAPDTSAWSEGGGITLSKETDGHRWLRVQKAATGYGFANQNVLSIGKRYRLQGYAKGDGTIAPVIYDSGAVQLFSGSNVADWQYCDVTFNPIGIRLDLASLFPSSGHVGFRNVRITEIGKYYPPVLWHSDWGANVSVDAVTSGQIDNTPFEVSSGSFRIVDDEIDGEEVKAIECVTNGTVLFPSALDGSDSNWTGWVDTGSGYAETTLSLSSLVYTMTSGDKIALSDRAGNYSIVKV